MCGCMMVGSSDYYTVGRQDAYLARAGAVVTDTTVLRSTVQDVLEESKNPSSPDAGE